MNQGTKLLAGFALSLCSAAVMAADTGGEIRGHVESSQGVDLANATIIVKHKTKGVERSITTNKVGDYALRNLPVGEYLLVISGDGFESLESEIKIIIGKPVVIDSVLGDGSNKNVVLVVGSIVKGLDMAETTAGRSFDSLEMELMPLENGFESMVLMTPGTIENGAPGAFNGASSIGGASSAENGYYLNGINITQIQSGLGSFSMPWEAIDQTNVMTTGIGAEFGGALGGIVNSVSKSGDNDFKFGAEYRLDPSFGYTSHPSVRLNDPSDRFMLNNQRDDLKFSEYSLWASGPIVEDKAFFYVLFNPQTTNSEGAGNTTFSKSETTSDRWFVNLDWYVTDNHSIGLTAFNTKRETARVTQPYDVATNNILPLASGVDGKSFNESGGTFTGINYHGELSDSLSLDVVWGRTEEEEIPRPANARPLVEDCLSSSCVTFSTHSNSVIENQKFTRDQFRADFHWDLDDHAISFGIDNYDIDVYVNNTQNGVVIGDIQNVDDSAATGWWAYGISGTDSTIVGGEGVTANSMGVADGTEFIRRRIRNRFSDSTVTSQAFYLQDSWQVSDQVTLNLGLRYMDFANTVSSGEKYADLTGNIAPRLAAIWDVGGKGEDKVFVSFGRYYQAVAARMNITQGSSSVEYFDFYENPTAGVLALNDDGSPVRGASIIPRDFRQTGITDPNLIASKNLKAMYSDQFSLGYSTEIAGFAASVRGTFNELGRSVEDTDYGPVLSAKLDELGITDNTGQGSFYILANPGDAVEIAYDFDGDGTVDNITLNPDDLQLAKPVRKYIAWDFVLDGPVSDDFSIFASYTWSHSWGNTEGLVKTTNGQADPGWTSDYDYGDALDHAMGDLPNDRRHSLKVSGIYDIADSMTLGLVYRGASGRPLNTLNPHPVGVDSCAPSSPWADCISRYYIGGFYDENGNPAPRGSAGNLDWTHKFDLAFSYRNDEILDGLLLKATVFNLLAADTAIDVDEWSGPNYGLTEIYQSERYLSLSARVEF